MFVMEQENNLEAWSDKPFDGYTREVDSGFSAVYDNGYAIQNGVVTYTPSDEEKALRVRHERNAALEDSDIQMLSDNFARLSETEREEWTRYRAYLRDMPAQADFPNVHVLTFEEWRVR